MDNKQGIEKRGNMPLDGMSIKILGHELHKLCVGSRIQNIFMPRKDHIILSTYRPGKGLNVALSLNPSSPGLYISSEKFKNPKTPYGLCMFLRKHVQGAIIRDVYTKDYERIIFIDVVHTDEADSTTDKKLIIELTGRNCNFIVTDDKGRILDALRHVDEYISSVRRIMPASMYVPPPAQQKKSIDNITYDDLLKYKDLPTEQAIYRSILGCTVLFGKEVCFQAKINETALIKQLDFVQVERLMTVLKDFSDSLNAYTYQACGIYEKDKKTMTDFWWTTPFMYQNKDYPVIRKFDTFIDAYSMYMEKKSDNIQLGIKKESVAKSVRYNIDKLHKKINIYQNSLSAHDEIEKNRLYGELLTSYAYMDVKRKDSVTVFNYHANENMDIPLDKKRDIAQNALVYFKKYKRALASYEYAKKMMVETNREKDYLESVLSLLNIAENPEDVFDILQELISQGYVKQKQEKKKAKYKKIDAGVNFSPYRYISSEGYEIYAGRNNSENDLLTFKYAQSFDIWLHAKGVHGSHVVIKNREKKEEYVPDKTLTQAAIIAKHHSEARNSGQSSVDYTFIKNVKKPKGSKPGYVNYFNYHSAYVTADDELIEKLRVQDHTDKP